MTLNALQIPLTQWQDGSIRVKGSRLAIDGIIYAYRQGEIPEAIFESYPSESYTVADIYAIIAYYLSNKEKFDKYLAKREKEALEIRKKIESKPGYKEVSGKLREKILARQKELRK
jgi:uncharacterized protein (DUF433 family)